MERRSYEIALKGIWMSTLKLQVIREALSSTVQSDSALAVTDLQPFSENIRAEGMRGLACLEFTKMRHCLSAAQFKPALRQSQPYVDRYGKAKYWALYRASRVAKSLLTALHTMTEARMPTLFEILNRFSKPPVDLWSFYVFLREQYGGFEYLEFWLDCANHNALCKEFVKSHMRNRNSQNSNNSDTNDTAPQVPPRASSRRQVSGNGSPSSSILFDMLRDDVLDVGSNHRVHDEERDAFDMDNVQHSRFHTTSDERLKTKRDTVSRLSALLDNMRIPEMNANESANNTRYSRVPNQSPLLEARSPEISHSIPRANGHSPKGTADSPNDYRPESYPSSGSVTRQTIRESAQRIVATYMTPKSQKEIELPADNQGWSLADDVRQLVNIPGGLDNPKIFDPAMTYVFEALEREALPAFLIRRALSNVQPVSSALRLGVGLLALFGAFWLSFVFVLLNWKPTSHRCWVILPFAFGWYLTMSALYHIDPLLALARLGESDGGGVLIIQEPFVKTMLFKRGIFVLVATVLITAAFSVLFIFVPGHRL